MIELLAGVARIPVSLWASLFVAGLFAWLSLLAAVKAEQKVGDDRVEADLKARAGELS